MIFTVQSRNDSKMILRVFSLWGGGGGGGGAGGSLLRVLEILAFLCLTSFCLPLACTLSSASTHFFFPFFLYGFCQRYYGNSGFVVRLLPGAAPICLSLRSTHVIAKLIVVFVL